MTPERWGKLEELYQAARALPPSERTMFLQQADSELRATVLSILAQEGILENGDPPREDRAFLDRPAWEGRMSLLKHAGRLQGETPVSVGQHLGPYRIEQQIGQGGMGTVYRATDTRLQRPVAIKISRWLFDERLEREGRAISSLNHPHICTLYDIGPDYIVMELVEGETMAARIRKGALPIDEVLRYGAQIAGALAAAHDKNITHRDLKPANVMITKNGVKVLDFGLAKCSTQDETLTRTGAVMGTPAYMAPEQLKGKPAGARTDIFALGLTLHEMATGAPVAPGRTPGMDRLPEKFAHIVERCLELEPEARWQSARDVKAELEWTAARELGTRLGAEASVLPPKRTLWMAVVALSVGLAGAIAWWLLWDRPAPPAPALNASLLPPPNTSFRFGRNGEGGFALSPDGTRLAFVGRTEGKAQLWVRSLADSESRLLPNTEGAYDPFWSPDSRWIAYFTPLKLQKMEVASGAVVDLRNKPGTSLSGSWGARGVILYGLPGYNPSGRLLRIPDTGGSPLPMPETEGAASPCFLPDGRRYFFLRGDFRKHDLWLASLAPDEKARNLGEIGTQPTYSAGHVLSVINGILMARPFDLARGDFAGESFPLKPLASRLLFGHLLTDFSANAQGILVYPPQANSLTQLRWRGRTGKQLGSLGAPGEYYTPRISPDGSRVAFSRRDDTNADIWVANLNTDSLTRLTFDPAVDENPVWSGDGMAVTFGNDASGHAELYRKAASGAGTIDRLTTATVEQQPLDWSRDGRFLVYTHITAPTQVMIQAASGGQPVSFLGQHAHGAVHAQFNPGVPRWIAYDFDDSGRREVYVQAFEPGKAASSARWQISNAGGQMPRWRGDGKEIFYLSLDGKMMAAHVSGDDAAFQSSTPQFLFNASPPQMRTPNFEYDVTADGERFLMIEPLERPEYLPLTLVSNWRLR